ncbi:MAG: isoleucine--tRNA ligase [Candidatus Omnitrophica bacterium]|nr:isoleucine--tRNA ligase [Candidatus Omnitrophota bacterium]
MDYSETVYLPKTSFPMKGNLSEREPEFLRLWEERQIYRKLQDKNKKNPVYILHDGPPYANGHIHLGTALNKILKDVVVKYRSLNGFYSPYIPGWDCHGMPIEHQVFLEIKKHKNEVDVSTFRKRTTAYAMKFVNIQKEEFRRLGVLGDWDNPYLTLSPEYEATIVRAFGELALSGYIYQGYKPIYWCISCETALAEAEIEYNDKNSPAIYVKFPVLDMENTYILIWTTTPWTLPSNTGIAVHPELEYVVIEIGGERYIIGEKRLQDTLMKKGQNGSIIKRFKGTELESLKYSNPLVERVSHVILADFVSSEEGTGCVHIAPGHGEDDYYAALKNNLEVLSPVDEKGRFTEEVKEFAGMRVFDADKHIIEKLEKKDALFYKEEITHSYPHCWRCKKPVIFKSTTQWFLKIDHNRLRDVMIKEIEKVKWVPSEGKNRISSMVKLRPDWCLSRQRLWGVPIPVFYCCGCEKSIITRETIDYIEKLVRQYGSDVWIEKTEEQLLPDGFTCPYCGGKRFRKEKDILDVWFDSGVSHLAVLKGQNGLGWPADLYLEGSDQHRGWFQTSLITSTGIKNRAPYKTVLTHGFVVDAEGRKMSKSLGNVITPQEIIKKYGAEILRIWAIAENYQQDIKISEGIVKNIVGSYRTIRNTLRYLLGNLYDYHMEEAVSEQDMKEVDRWALEKLKETVNNVTQYYETFSFNKAYEEIYRFCNVSLSSFYLDHLKDRLYTYGKNSIERRSARTALYKILTELVKVIAPVLSFTAEEAYQLLPWEKKESVFLEDWPEINQPDKKLLERWERFFDIRKIVLKKIEEKREEKVIGSGLEAKVIIKADKETLEFLKGFEGLEGLFIVSEVLISSGENLDVTVEKTSFGKCQRCWVHFPEIGSPQAPEICFKCQKVLEEDGIHN